jgi:hypothetical protein
MTHTLDAARDARRVEPPLANARRSPTMWQLSPTVAMSPHTKRLRQRGLTRVALKS